ncbi:zinc finger protein 513-like [Xyrauchen texanus]|uniref:zinc finger protein 513-like n=1 Tax=Xyrauchen texanus TaxID=154827 RepID=UPI002242C0ED|nr:zinc finger protein 513-like [Xyrauchen texanus]
MCPLCIYSTNRPAAMEGHLKTHYKMEYRCRICQAVWANQAELERHTRGHRLGNHYKCEQCGYLSKTANKLIEHVRVHTGERPFHCDRCSYSCKRKDNLNLHKRLKHAPRQTFGCTQCPFTTTHPFVYSRHVKKHQGGEGITEDGEAQPGTPCPGLLESGEGSSGSGDSGSTSPLMSLSASQALQSVALSITSKQRDGTPRPRYLSANGTFSTLSAHYLEPYRNCDLAHLLPLTTLFTTRRFTFHSPSPSNSSTPFSRAWSDSPSQSPPSPTSLKHSFLTYLGLTERAKTI